MIPTLTDTSKCLVVQTALRGSTCLTTSSVAVNKGDVTQLGASGVDGVIASAIAAPQGPVYTLSSVTRRSFFRTAIMLRVAITAQEWDRRAGDSVPRSARRFDQL